MSGNDLDFESNELEDIIALIHFANWKKQEIALKLIYLQQLTGPSSEVVADVTKPIDLF